MKTLRAYISIARPDHWFKSVFALPGFLFALIADPSLLQEPGSWMGIAVSLTLAVAALCLTASSNYVINELLDAPTDRQHPTKKNRPAAKGDVSAAGAITLWLVLGALGVGLAFGVNLGVGISCAVLWVMGVVYNVPPVRSKELPYGDVLSESVNNPIRLWLGWAAAGSILLPPASLLLSYWMLGAFFMAVKRFAEYRQIGDPDKAAAYRRSFAWYTEERLLVSLLAYAAASAMFGGMFIVRYRLELVLAVPFFAVIFAWYLHVGLKPDSAAIRPERLYREPGLTGLTLFTFMLACALLVIEIPALQYVFAPTVAFEPMP